MPPAPLLDLLPAAERERLQSRMRRVCLESGQTVALPQRPMEAVYFPIDCIVSVIARGEVGEQVEAGLIGCEGVAGLPLFLREKLAPHQMTCQVPGEAWRMGAEEFVAESARPSALSDVLLRYTHAFLAMTAQGVLCNAAHGVDERCARWLLSIHDRVGRDSFALTQEYLAVMLAVRRPGVSVAMGSLKRAGAIDYHRGQMIVVDRVALEAASCPCHELTAAHFAGRQAEAVLPHQRLGRPAPTPGPGGPAATPGAPNPH